MGGWHMVGAGGGLTGGSRQAGRPRWHRAATWPCGRPPCCHASEARNSCLAAHSRLESSHVPGPAGPHQAQLPPTDVPRTRYQAHDQAQHPPTCHAHVTRHTTTTRQSTYSRAWCHWAQPGTAAAPPCHSWPAAWTRQKAAQTCGRAVRSMAAGWGSDRGQEVPLERQQPAANRQSATCSQLSPWRLDKSGTCDPQPAAGSTGAQHAPVHVEEVRVGGQPLCQHVAGDGVTVERPASR